MMVGSGATPVWCGVMFVPNLLLLFYRAYMRTHTKEKPFVGVAMRPHNRATL